MSDRVTGVTTGSPGDSRTPATASGAAAAIRLRGRVLIAEDNPVNQKVTVAMCRKLGLEVVVVADGDQAVSTVAAGGVDLVLMDCQMPIRNGFEACAAIRACETDGRHLPVVALTASALPEERARCLDAGMDAFLSKPVSLNDLAQTLGRWLERHVAPT
ncbi:MAG: response regulator [Planctomycetes bacterium]|nr:response regulator [Planctomycetota bacterium]